MSDDGRRQHLDELIRRRDQLKEQIQRVKGRLEAARTDVATVEAECRKRGVEPDQLEDAIQRLSDRYTEVVQDLETRIQQSEQELKPFLGEV